jgi:hypothetical protein
MEWVNFNAFEANLTGTGVFASWKAGHSVPILRWAFEERKRRSEPWEQDYDVMAAAQWIIWNGQALFKAIIYTEGDGDDVKNNGSSVAHYWQLGDDLKGSPMTPCSIERWRFWKTSFEAVQSDPDAMDECKMVSSRAADLMGSIERSMLFPTVANERHG